MTRWIKKLTLVAMGCFAVTAFAQEPAKTEIVEKKSEKASESVKDPAAIEILKKADAAVKKITAIKYKAVRTASGWAASRVPTVQGTAVVSGVFNNGYEKFLFEVEVTDPVASDAKETKETKSAGPRKLITGGNGETYFLVDWQNKKAHVDLDPSVVGSDGFTAQSLGMPEFVHPHPFDDEMNAEQVKLLAPVTVSGEECNVVDVDYGQRRGHSIWYFSKKDDLPRKRELMIKGQDNQEGKIEIVVSSLEINPKLDDAVFELKLPEGFEKTDEFAPNRAVAR